MFMQTARTQCASGKHRWNRRAGAHRQAKRLTRMNRSLPAHVRGEHGGLEVRAYECDECGGWHVTSTPNRVKP